MGYKYINIEISGTCNAKCPYCITGKGNIEKKGIRNEHMELEEFKKIYKHLKENKIIDVETQISLYNWKEPFLNRELEEIMIFLSESNQPFVLSTNASIEMQFKPDAIKMLKMIIFSMPGFSQESYDKIHGFSFERIKNNIREMVNYCKKSSSSKYLIAYHVYLFNEKELKAAKEFTEELGISIHPSYAFLNGTSLSFEYLDNKMPYEELKKASREINLGYVDQLIAEMPSNYNCPELERLTIDEKGRLLLCCGTDENCENHVIGSIYDFKTIKQINEKRIALLQVGTCKKCMDTGLAYWTHNPPQVIDHESEKKKYKKYYELLLQLIDLINRSYNLQDYFNEKQYKKIAIYGMGKIGRSLYDYMQKNDIAIEFSIDRNLEQKLYKDIPIISIAELGEKEEKPDLIIVTIPITNALVDELSCKGSKEIIALEELLKSAMEE